MFWLSVTDVSGSESGDISGDWSLSWWWPHENGRYEPGRLGLVGDKGFSPGIQEWGNVLGDTILSTGGASIWMYGSYPETLPSSLVCPFLIVSACNDYFSIALFSPFGSILTHCTLTALDVYKSYEILYLKVDSHFSFQHYSEIFSIFTLAGWDSSIYYWL